MSEARRGVAWCGGDGIWEQQERLVVVVDSISGGRRRGEEAECQREGAEGQEPAAAVELLVLPRRRGAVRGRRSRCPAAGGGR
jgi:hypothetical protein